MNLLYLSTWATILRIAASERIAPIVSFNDPAEALRHMHYQNAAGDDIRAVTNDQVVYWLVSAALASRLYQAGFHPVSNSRSVLEAAL